MFRFSTFSKATTMESANNLNMLSWGGRASLLKTSSWPTGLSPPSRARCPGVSTWESLVGLGSPHLCTQEGPPEAPREGICLFLALAATLSSCSRFKCAASAATNLSLAA